MKMKIILMILQTLFFVFTLFGKDASSDGIPECHPAKTCGNCMRINLQCSWCAGSNISSDAARCDGESYLIDAGCAEEDIVGRRSTVTLLKNEALQDPVYRNDSDDELLEQAVPIRPQQVKVSLRPGDTQTIRVGVRQVNDYPVDLYYLMDLSYSMNDDLNNLRSLGENLATKMKSITRSFALGFGTFVDKPIAPFSSAEKLQQDRPPCTGCVPAYGFRNELRLDKSTSLFQERVRGVSISQSQDKPEGTLDAIAQAVVCTDEIGWRNESRRLLLITSDASFHIEGDGKMAGILRPFDGNCHLEDNVYHKTHYYDYPSVGQLNNVLVDNNIIAIFAMSGAKGLYRDLSRLLPGANFSELRTDSSNIVDIVSDNYQNITGSVKVTDTAPEGVSLRYKVNCSGETGWLDPGEKPTCDQVHAGEEIFLDVEVKATKCANYDFEIYPIGFESHLKVQVEVICTCECESSPDNSSSVCTDGNGNLVCGMCQCLPGRYGDECECTAENEGDQDQARNELKCKPDNDTTVVCSGRGECICGECRCNNPAETGVVISGTYCECNNQACDLADGEVCGGPERGECVCALDGRSNECQCRPGYSGDSCDCPTQTESCRANNGLICNAIGTCKCGKCICDKSSKFTGPRCDECVSCDECDLHVNCVLCKVFNNTENLSEEECDMCSQEIQNATDATELEDNQKSCSFLFSKDCSVSFQYGKINDTMYITVHEPDCGHATTIFEGTEVHLVILYIVLGIILIGLLIIFIFRLYTWYLDRVEYQQFLKEKETATWEKSDNPIYKPTTSTIQNPAYGRGSVKT